MRFLLDQDVYAITVRFLVDTGHDVVLAAQLGLSQASDEEILRTSQKDNRILVTRDRDYGNLVFVRAIGTGVIYLRILPTTINVVHDELVRVLKSYSEVELSGAFIVVEPDGHRFRKLPPRPEGSMENPP
jgi:predicted nuclease of predicted toxin-antitoxin system